MLLKETSEEIIHSLNIFLITGTGAQQRYKLMVAGHTYQMQFTVFARILGCSTQVRRHIIPRVMGRPRGLYKLLNVVRKLQVTSKQGWSRVLQIAASTYRMVPHEATGIFPFLMLYGREAIMPEEIDHTVYVSNSDYGKTGVIIQKI